MHVERATVRAIVDRLEAGNRGYAALPLESKGYDRALADVRAEMCKVPDVDPDLWGPVIDQVVGLATVYDIVHEGPTTPEQVADLWAQVIYVIAIESRAKGRTEGFDRGSEGHADLTTAADRWHLLTEHLGPDLRIDPDDVADDDDVEVWRKRIRDALWMAYGIGRRHERKGRHFVEHGGHVSPFDSERSTTT